MEASFLLKPIRELFSHWQETSPDSSPSIVSELGIVSGLMGNDVFPRLLGRLLSFRVNNPTHADQLNEIPSETSESERRFLYNFFANIWLGQGHVLEIGPFLGGSTRAIAMGMLSNPKRQPHCKLYTFDKFADYYGSENLLLLLDPLFKRGVLKEEMRETIRRSTNFKRIFNMIHENQEYFPFLMVKEEVLPDTVNQTSTLENLLTLDPGLKFDAVFVDACKSWYGTKYFMLALSKCTEAGAYFIFQDYGWYTCFWIPVFVGLMKEYFQLVAYVDHTYTFQLRRPLDINELYHRFPDIPDALGKLIFDPLFSQLLCEAMERNDTYALLSYSLQHVAALTYIGEIEEAKAKIMMIASRPEFKRFRKMIANAGKSPTYSPQGNIYLLKDDINNSTNTPCPETLCSIEAQLKISGIRPAVSGIFISLQCRACGKEFESYQTTIAGVPIARHICPGCRTIYEVGPEIFLAALERYMPPASFKEMVQITEEASRIAETWYRSPGLADLLTYQEINLGEPMERELLAFITTGLYSHWAASNGGRRGKTL